jgi:predicted secreted hydrolase
VNVLLKSDSDTALTPEGGGWDWFSIQLDNDTEMMLYLIRDAMGKTVSTYVELTGHTRGSFPCSKKFERMRVDILS